MQSDPMKKKQQIETSENIQSENCLGRNEFGTRWPRVVYCGWQNVNEKHTDCTWCGFQFVLHLSDVCRGPVRNCTSTNCAKARNFWRKFAPGPCTSMSRFSFCSRLLWDEMRYQIPSVYIRGHPNPISTSSIWSELNGKKFLLAKWQICWLIDFFLAKSFVL